MSESDDTDELLLVTPQVDNHTLDDHFVPYYNVCDQLITQVSQLKSRITCIENSSDISLGSITNSIDTLLNMRSSDSSNLCRRCYSYESLPQHSECRRGNTQCLSTQSTPQKPRSKLMLKSENNSPNYNDKNFKRPLHRSGVPRNKNGIHDSHDEGIMKNHNFVEERNVIRQIDDFLTKVKPTIKSNAVKTLDFEMCTDEYLENKDKTVDMKQILQEMDVQEERLKQMIENKLDSNSGESNSENNSDEPKNWVEPFSLSSSSSSVTDNTTVRHKPSDQIKGGINVSSPKHLQAIRCDKSSQGCTYTSQAETTRESTTNNRVSNTSTVEETVLPEYHSSSSYSTKKSVSSPHFDVHTNAKDVLLMHQKLLDRTKSPEFGSFIEPFKNTGKMGESNLGTLSLVNLWNNNNNHNKSSEKNAEKCIQKLQEEKLRRTHCEELIQQLQNKILEQQEKLAVAIQVDEAKDTAIIRFHDAWEKATRKFKLVVKERDQLERDLENLVTRNNKLTEESDERVEFHSIETNRALTMLHQSQKNHELVEKKFKDLHAEHETTKTSNQKLENRIREEEEKNKRLSEILANKEIELNESKNILLHAKEEVTQCQNAVEVCHKDFQTIKIEYELIQEEIKIEKQTITQLHEENRTLLEELENLKIAEAKLQNVLKEAQEKLETNKKELRNFYQGQVELLVQTKLKEFQGQLEQAEQKMKKELEKKETDIAKAAALHIQQINDKYTLEINLLEQKHQEEMHLKQVKTAQLEQRLHDLQIKYQHHQDRKSDLVKQLQKVMEAQWAEALRIINCGRSPVPNEDSASTIDQLHSLHSRSFHNMEALLNVEDKSREQHQQQQRYGDYCNGELDKGRKREERKHEQCGRGRISKSHEGGGHLEKYINLLLQKPPGNPLDSKEKSPRLFCDQPTSDKTAWQQLAAQYAKSELQERDFHEGIKRKTWK